MSRTYMYCLPMYISVSCLLLLNSEEQFVTLVDL